MSSNSSAGEGVIPGVPTLADLPPSLRLPPHLSAQKYFFVCTLTVAAWDTLVLSPRALRLWRSEGWPPLKIMFHFLRFFMPAEFIVVAVAFFDTNFTQSQCHKFYLFEPICTAILLATTSAVHVIRIHAIYDRSRPILTLMGTLWAVQVVITAICCGFYRSVPLDVGQGCIAGPRHAWVGLYWVSVTLLYLTSFFLAAKLSLASRSVKQLSLWKLMLRDGLNLYGSIALVNLTNMIFWFVMPPTGPEDPVKTIVTSMAAVLTTSMTLRIILAVRGPLAHGGSYAGASAGSGSTSGTHSGGLHGASGPGPRSGRPTYTLDDQLRSAAAASKGGVEEWGAVGALEDGKSSVLGVVSPTVVESKGVELEDPAVVAVDGEAGVKITIDREVEYDLAPAYLRTRGQK